MKTRLTILLAAAAFSLIANTSFGALDMTFTGPNYNPNNYGGQILDGGALRLVSGDGSSSISGTFTRGDNSSGQFAENLVLFIDSTAGGFQDTRGFSGAGLGLLSAASGISAGGSGSRSTAYFGAPAGQSFGADYVVAVGVTYGGAVFRINPNGALEQVQRFTISPNDQLGSRQFNFNFDWSSVGVTDPSTRGFRFYSSYVTEGGARRLDSMETITGTAGLNYETWFNNYRIFGVDPVPEMTNVALAVFGGLVLSGSLAVRARRYLARRRLA